MCNTKPYTVTREQQRVDFNSALQETISISHAFLPTDRMLQSPHCWFAISTAYRGQEAPLL